MADTKNPVDLQKAKSTPPFWARGKKDEETEDTQELATHNQVSLEERRKLYLCKENYITLQDIVLWPLMWKLRRDKSSGESPKSQYAVNHDINMKISLIQNDITKLEIDAVVNAANTSLLGGGGVDGCIHRAAGRSQLRKACQKLDGCGTGCSKITPGFKLPAKYIIHTVGPVGENTAKLRSCYDTSLDLCLKHSIRTIAFCCISTGIYSYPNQAAAIVALETTRKWLNTNAEKVDRVIFCTFLNEDYQTYEEQLAVYFPCEEEPSEAQTT